MNSPSLAGSPDGLPRRHEAPGGAVFRGFRAVPRVEYHVGMPTALILLASLLLAPSTQPSAEPPIYRMSPAQLGDLLPQWQRDVPALNERVVAIARRNLGQPYEIYLLGEAPFETIDAQPVYCLERSDCVVFVEHTLAMALSDSFPGFLRMLQRIRYDGGKIGVITRNHYTEADWNRNNRWLLNEVTDAAGGASVKTFTQKVDRAKFFRERYKLDAAIPVESIEERYIPIEAIDAVKSRVRAGDVVNFVSGRAGSNAMWVGHVGLVGRAPDGTVTFIHSVAPWVREETVEDYVAAVTSRAAEKDAEGKARVRGFKFLRLVDNPMANLVQLDGPHAPAVWLPAGSPVAWEQFVKMQSQ
jgi:hypothetical protein